MGQFDEVFKRTLRDGSITFIKKYLKESFEIEASINIELHTLVKESDFIFLIKQNNQEKLLQIEVQTEDDATMLERMLIYAGLIYEQHKKPLKQIVLYLGRTIDAKSKKMLSDIDMGYFTYKYKLINISEIDYHKFLDAPETLPLAILGKYEPKNIKNVLKTILEKSKSFLRTNAQFAELQINLEIIAQLRNLQEEVKQLTLKLMPVTIDPSQTSFFEKGFEKGIEKGFEKGIEKGFEKGFEKGKIQTAKAFILLGKNTHQEIAQATGLPLKQIEELAKEVKKKK